MGTTPTGFDRLAQAGSEAGLQRQRIKEEQRVQEQNNVGAQLLDAINNASDIKPQTKDENGNIIHNPEYDNAQAAKQKLLQQYTTLMSPEQHANFAQHLHGLIFGHHETRPQQPALSPNTSPNDHAVMPTAAPGAGASPTPAPPPHPFETNHPVLGKIEEGLKGLRNHLSAFVHPLPPQEKPDMELAAKYYRDPSEVQHERTMEMWGLRGENALNVAKERTKALIASLAARPPRLLSQSTIPDFLQEWKTDPNLTVVDSQGNALTPAQLMEMPPNSVVREFKAGGNVFYSIGDQNTKVASFGGISYQIPALGAITPGNSTALGTTTSALPKSHEVPGMNPGEKIPLITKPTETPGMTGGAPPAAPAPATTPAGVTGEANAEPITQSTPPTPTLKTRPQPSASQAAINGKLNAKRSQSRQIPTPNVEGGNGTPAVFAKGTMLQQGRPAMATASAMSVVASNVFGAPGTEEKPIWANAWMYDKPELRQALNNALTLNALKNPGTEDNPSMFDAFKTAIGATQWSQEQINDAAVHAREEVERIGGPEALKQFAREAAMQEDLSALRVATKASAAQGSIALNVRAAPVYNVANAQDFRNQLGTMLSTAGASMRGYPMLNPEYVKWWEKQTAQAKGGPVSKNSPGHHDFAYDADGKKHPVLDQNAPLPKGWSWIKKGE